MRGQQGRVGTCAASVGGSGIGLCVQLVGVLSACMCCKCVVAPLQETPAANFSSPRAVLEVTAPRLPSTHLPPLTLTLALALTSCASCSTQHTTRLGCAFVTFSTWAAAESAMEAVNGTFTMPGELSCCVCCVVAAVHTCNCAIVSREYCMALSVSL